MYDERIRGGNERYFGDVLVYAPCNYASNVAFYRTVTRICDFPFWSGYGNGAYFVEIKRSLTHMGSASAFMHGENTYMGRLFDNKMMAVVAWLIHSMCIKDVPVDPSALRILQDLSLTTREHTALETSEIITNLMIDEEPMEWTRFLDTGDYVRDSYGPYGALAVTFVSLMLPSWIATPLLHEVVSLVSDEDQRTYLKDHYI